MNRINKLFKEKRNILSIYFTAGYPSLDSTQSLLRELQESKVDIVEIGIPFSDPLADGPVIQNSSEIAIANGMTINKLFDQLKEIRNTINIPLVLMGYLNPVLQYGFERFCKRCSEIGIDGLIIPDLPIKEFEKHYKSITESNNLKLVFLITPQSSEERIRQIDNLSDGFIYMVSSASTTGSKLDTGGSETYFKRIQKMNLKNPLMIGFGISDKESLNAAWRYANGAIIGSAFIRAINAQNDTIAAAKQFVQQLLN